MACFMQFGNTPYAPIHAMFLLYITHLYNRIRSELERRTCEMKKLNYGMVGGGPGSFIGDAHRKSINIDAMAQLVAGCFSRTLEKCQQTGEAFPHGNAPAAA